MPQSGWKSTPQDGKACSIKCERGRRLPCFRLPYCTCLYPPPWADRQGLLQYLAFCRGDRPVALTVHLSHPPLPAAVGRAMPGVIFGVHYLFGGGNLFPMPHLYLCRHGRPLEKALRGLETCAEKNEPPRDLP